MTSAAKTTNKQIQPFDIKICNPARVQIKCQNFEPTQKGPKKSSHPISKINHFTSAFQQEYKSIS